MQFVIPFIVTPIGENVLDGCQSLIQIAIPSY